MHEGFYAVTYAGYINHFFLDMNIFDLIYMNGWVNVHMQLAEMIPY